MPFTLLFYFSLQCTKNILHSGQKTEDEIYPSGKTVEKNEVNEADNISHGTAKLRQKKARAR